MPRGAGETGPRGGPRRRVPRRVKVRVKPRPAPRRSKQPAFHGRGSIKGYGSVESIRRIKRQNVRRERRQEARDILQLPPGTRGPTGGLERQERILTARARGRPLVRGTKPKIGPPRPGLYVGPGEKQALRRRSEYAKVKRSQERPTLSTRAVKAVLPRLVEKELTGRGVITKKLTEAGGFVREGVLKFYESGGATPTPAGGAAGRAIGRKRIGPKRAGQVEFGTLGGKPNKKITRALANLAGDPFDLAAQAIPSTALTVQAILDETQGDPRARKKLLREYGKTGVLPALAKGDLKEVGKRLYEHPIAGALEVSGAKAVVGRGLGGTARAGGALRGKPKGQRGGKLGATDRRDLQLYPSQFRGTGPTLKRTYSKDALTKLVQVGLERRSAKGKRVSATLAGLERGTTNVASAQRRSRELRRLVDDEAFISNQLIKHERQKAIEQTDKTIHGKRLEQTLRNIVDEPVRQGDPRTFAARLAVEGVLTDPAKLPQQLRHYRNLIVDAVAARVASGEAPLTHRQAKNVEAVVGKLDHLLKDVEFQRNPNKYLGGAIKYARQQTRRDVEGEDLGVLLPDEAAAKYVPAAVVHLGAEYVRRQPTDKLVEYYRRRHAAKQAGKDVGRARRALVTQQRRVARARGKASVTPARARGPEVDAARALRAAAERELRRLSNKRVRDARRAALAEGAAKVGVKQADHKLLRGDSRYRRARSKVDEAEADRVAADREVKRLERNTRTPEEQLAAAVERRHAAQVAHRASKEELRVVVRRLLEELDQEAAPAAAAAAPTIELGAGLKELRATVKVLAEKELGDVLAAWDKGLTLEQAGRLDDFLRRQIGQNGQLSAARVRERPARAPIRAQAINALGVLGTESFAARSSGRGAALDWAEFEFRPDLAKLGSESFIRKLSGALPRDARHRQKIARIQTRQKKGERRAKPLSRSMAEQKIKRTQPGRFEELENELEGLVDEGSQKGVVRAYAYLKAQDRLLEESPGSIPGGLYERLLNGDTAGEVVDFAYDLLREYEKRDAEAGPAVTATLFDTPEQAAAAAAAVERPAGPPLIPGADVAGPLAGKGGRAPAAALAELERARGEEFAGGRETRTARKKARAAEQGEREAVQAARARERERRVLAAEALSNEAKTVYQQQLDAAKVRAAEAKGLARAGKPRPHEAYHTGFTINGKPIKLREIEDRLRAVGISPEHIAFVSQRPFQRGASNYYMAQLEKRPTIYGKSRTGAATELGLVDPSKEPLIETAAYSAVRNQTARNWDRMFKFFAVRPPRLTRTATGELRVGGGGWLKDYGEAIKVAKEVSDEGGMEVVPIEISSFMEKGARAARVREQLGDTGYLNDEAFLQQLSDALIKSFENPKPNGRYALIPAEVLTRLKAHAAPTSEGSKAVQAVLGPWTKTILATSPKWVPGNVIDLTGRLLLEAIGPLSVYRGIKAARMLRDVNEVAYRNLVERAVGGTLYTTTASGMRHVTAETFAKSGLRDMALAAERFGRSKPVLGLRLAWNGWTKTIFGLNRSLEILANYGALGKHVRTEIGRTMESVEGFLVTGGPAFEKFVKEGLINQPEQIAASRFVEQVYGRWGKMGPATRDFLIHYSPFLQWLRVATKFVFLTMPTKHPIKTGILAGMYEMTEKDREALGMTLFPDKSVPYRGPSGELNLPDFLQGSIPLPDGSKIRFQNFNSFGVYAGAPASLADFLLPQVSGAALNLSGLQWTGDKLRHNDGRPVTMLEKIMLAIDTTAAGFVPLWSHIHRARVGGEPSPTSTQFAPEKKKNAKGGGYVDRVFNPLRPIPPYERRGSAAPSGGSILDQLDLGGGGSTLDQLELEGGGSTLDQLVLP